MAPSDDAAADAAATALEASAGSFSAVTGWRPRLSRQSLAAIAIGSILCSSHHSRSPLAEDSALIDAGLDFALGERTPAGASYTEQFGAASPTTPSKAISLAVLAAPRSCLALAGLVSR